MRTLSWLAFISLLALLLPRNVVGKEAVADPPAKAESKTEIPTALQDYVNAPDDSYGYEVVGSEKIDGCTVHKLDLTSQTWHDIPWKHALYIYVPANIQHKQTVLLFITGGRVGGTPSGADMKMAAKFAQAAAMTAVQGFGKQNYGVDVEQFVVTGGSKRGWTSWLTAVADDRVAGIAPIVIDTLNMPAQMKYQLETWGEYSEQIADYTSKGLVKVMENRPELPLWQWVDPYTYRSVLTLPKLLINGTNDRYWTVDAMNIYWDDLQGEKHVRYVPNAGHGLDDGKEGALMTLAAFAQHVAEDKPLPELKWTHEGDDGEYRLKINSTPTPESVRLWVAKSDTKDFRNAKWEATELKVSDEAGGDGEEFVGVVEKPATGHIALFGEATYRHGPLPYNLSTTLRRE